jgi:hypothetical protein
VATQTRNPTSDEAASGTLSGSAGSRWQLVDDYPDTNGADVLTFGTTAASITFGYSAFTVPAGSTSISVQVLYYDGEAANGANNCGGRLKVGGAYFNAATHNPAGTTYTSRTDNFANNPQTSAAWTVDQVNGVGGNALTAFGIGSTDSNPTFRVSSVQLQVTYTAPAVRTANVATQSTAQTSAMDGSVVVTADIATASSAQTSAMTGTVESSGVSADIATASSAQTSAMTASVLVAAAVATQASAQTTAMSGSVLVAAGVATRATAQTAAMDGGVVVSGAIATTSSSQTSAADTSVLITADVATVAAPQVSAMTGSTTGAAPAVTADIATEASSQIWASTGAVVVSANIATTASAQVASMGSGGLDPAPAARPARHIRAAWPAKVSRVRGGFSRPNRVRPFRG